MESRGLLYNSCHLISTPLFAVRAALCMSILLFAQYETLISFMITCCKSYFLNIVVLSETVKEYSIMLRALY